MAGFILQGCVQQETSLPEDNPSAEVRETDDLDEDVKESQITEVIKVFYGDSQNAKMIAEDREITYENDEDKYKMALEELIKGPKDKTLISNINKETKVVAVSKQGTDLVVDLSKEFNVFGGSIAEIIGVGSVVNTMTEFKDIERVKILIEGEEFIGPSGEPRGFMETFPLAP
jgi:spore germination protein GerM